MPSLSSCTCGLFGKKNKNEKDSPGSEEKAVEKTVYIVVPQNQSSTASAPPQTKSTTTELNQSEKAETTTRAQDSAPPAQDTTAELADTETTKEKPEPNSNEEMADQLKAGVSGVTNTVSSGAQQASSGVQSAASTAQNTASSGAEKVTGAASNPTGATESATDTAKSGTEHWDAMTEDQKKATYDSLPAEKKQGLTYMEWIKQGYQHQKENWMPWIEDQYLRWFTKDNKASYATKDSLDKTKVTGIEQVDNLQDGVNNLVSGQVGQGGLLQPVGDAVSKEGVNRAERGGKDESGSYAGAIGGGMKSVGGSVWSGAASAGSYVSGMLPGGKKQEPAAEESK